ncbi:MAG: hypothetical protein IPH59_01390 [bacterium]|nr:hypothetical protein [bacterium]
MPDQSEELNSIHRKYTSLGGFVDQLTMGARAFDFYVRRIAPLVQLVLTHRLPLPQYK